MKANNLIAVGIALSALFAASANAAGDKEKGKAKSAICAACHGPKGVSLIPVNPNIAGQKEAYLVSSMKAYRDGIRKDMQMAPMMASLSDDDINNLAAYFASLDPSGK